MFSKIFNLLYLHMQASIQYTHTPIYTHRKEVGMSWVPFPLPFYFRTLAWKFMKAFC